MENDLAHLKHKLDAVSLDLIRYQGELAARQDALDSGRDARLAAESDVDQRITDTSRMLSCLSRQLQVTFIMFDLDQIYDDCIQVLESVSDANKKLYEEQQGAVDLLASKQVACRVSRTINAQCQVDYLNLTLHSSISVKVQRKLKLCPVCMFTSLELFLTKLVRSQHAGDNWPTSSIDSTLKWFAKLLCKFVPS